MTNRKRLQIWRDAARSCGLRVVNAFFIWPKIEARAERVEVRFENGGNKGRSTRIVVMAPGSSDLQKVRIHPESPFRWTRESETGDLAFDRTFSLEGPLRLILAWFDAETRRLLLQVNHEGPLELSFDGLRVDLPDEKISSVLPLLLKINERFAQSIDVPRCLAENAQHDPKEGVRLQNLLYLIRHYPKAPQTAEALQAALSDSSPEIRLSAAKALGAEARGVLLALTESLENDAVSAEAVSALGQELPYERAKAILDRARGRRCIQTACACLEVLGHGGAEDAVSTLGKVMEQEKGKLAAAAAQALGAIGSPAAEPWLILALQRQEQDLRVAAANALALVGSVAAVPPLKEAAESSWLDLALRQATRQAIAEIQSRLQGASPGQLSMAEAEAGQLSLAQAEAGQLSLAADQTGQLSINGAEHPLKES